MGNYDRDRNDRNDRGRSEKRTPWGRAFAVIENEKDREKSQWLEIGVAWQNKDGGLSIVLDREPLAWRGATEAVRILIQRPKEER